MTSYTGVLNKLLSDENTNKNQMDSMKVDIKRAQNQFTTKSYLLVFGRYWRYWVNFQCLEFNINLFNFIALINDIIMVIFGSI